MHTIGEEKSAEWRPTREHDGAADVLEGAHEKHSRVLEAGCTRQEIEKR